MKFGMQLLLNHLFMALLLQRKRRKSEKYLLRAPNYNIIWLDRLNKKLPNVLTVTKLKDLIPFNAITKWGVGIVELDVNSGKFTICSDENLDTQVAEDAAVSELRKNAQAEREAFMKILTNPLSDEITGSQAVEMQNIFDAFFPTLTVDFVN